MLCNAIRYDTIRYFNCMVDDEAFTASALICVVLLLSEHWNKGINQLLNFFLNCYIYIYYNRFINKCYQTICRMTSRLADSRPTSYVCRELLEEDGQGAGVFPSYFGDLYELFSTLHWQGMLPDSRISIICSVRLTSG